MLSRARSVIVVALFLVGASCAQADQETTNVVPVGEAGESGPDETSQSADSGSVDSSNSEDGDSTDGDSVGGDSSFVNGFEPQRFDAPHVPPVTLPDLSVLGETGTLLKSELGDAIGSGTSLSVSGATCAAVGGELVYNGSDEADSFLEIETDGSGYYLDESALDGRVEISVEADGSGSYWDDTSLDGRLEITVEADGSGSYWDDRSLNGSRRITVESDGSGQYWDDTSLDGRLEVTINGDGTGSYLDDRSLDGRIEITVEADGSGSYWDDRSLDGRVEMTVDPDGTRSFWDDTSLSGRVELTVYPDGSGTYFNDTSLSGRIEIAVDANGAGTYFDDTGLSDTIELSFTTELGILDPDVVVLAPEPEFVVADRFPPLAKLGSLKPPCATVIRLDSSVLFDFDSDQLRPQAEPVLDQVADALAETDKTLEVHGHTDAKGDDPYNLDLSQRRAETVQAALVDRGVANEISATGFGESRPVAPNESADGSDNPAGRQQNRRVEIVIPE